VLHGFAPQGRLHLDDAGEGASRASTHATWLDKLIDDWEVVKPRREGNRHFGKATDAFMLMFLILAALKN
jgi:hypothetical protein